MARELGAGSWSYATDNGSRTDFQNQFIGNGNSQKEQANSFLYDIQRTADKIIAETHKENHKEAELADSLLKLRPFGLKLNLTPTLIDSMAKNLNHAAKPCYQLKVDDFRSQPISEKLKASNFSASFLRIGTWERRSRNEGDLVAKCYYAKKKLVWEFLEKGLKSKIEIQWNDIIAMKARIQENEPGILEIELSQAPTFHEETDPQPRKHTIWRLTSDFTGGLASTYRRHYLVFPPGALDKHYDKLLQCDPRLYGLSRRPFPSLESPYFEPTLFNYTNFPVNYHRERQLNFSGFPSPIVAVHRGQFEQAYPPLSFKETHSPISVMDFSHSDDQITNNAFENPRMAVWAPRTNYNNVVVDPIPDGIPFNPMNATPLSYYNYKNPSGFDQGGGSTLMNDPLIRNLADYLLSDTQVDDYDEKCHMARVASLTALVNLNQEVDRAGEGGSFYGQDLAASDQASVNLDYQQQQESISCLSFQLCPENAMMHQHQDWNNLGYSSVFPDSGVEDFGHVNIIDQMNMTN